MPLRESEAIVLRSYPLGEADRLVSFLCRAQGRMRGVAKGAKRLKSRFGSTLEPLSYVRVGYFERETRDLVRINQCELIESFLDVQRDYQQSLALSLMAEISEAVLPEREASDANFRLLLMASRQIREKGKTSLPLLYFSLWTVRLAGWLPDFNKCLKCGAPLDSSRAFAGVARPGVVGECCHTPGLRALSRESVCLAREMLRTKLDQLAEPRWTSPVPSDLRTYLLDVIEHQVEKKLTTRRMMETA